MRQLVVDQLSQEEWQRLENYLQRQLRPGPLAGIYWLELPRELWGEAQRGHEQCAPFNFALELTAKRLACELLIRGSGRLHCSCACYAEPAQREFLLNFCDRMLAEEMIRA